MISIIIPTKNEGKFIGKNLKQFLRVKKKYNLELIVSDGGSEDNTIKTAKKYADKVVLYKKKNKQKISEGRNAGAKVAKGDILVLFDADIKVGNLKDFFETVIEKFKDPEVVAATAPTYVYPKEETFSDKFFHFILNFLAWFANKFGIGGGRGECQIINNSVFKEVKGYNEKLVVAEDVDLFERLRKKGRILYLSNLKIYESPRRFRKYGYAKVFFLYIMNFIFNTFFKRSFSKEWKQVK